MLLAFVGDARTAHDALETLDGWSWIATPPLGSFYRHLKKAVASGWLEILEPPERNDGVEMRGRPGRRYRLTAEGTVALRSALETTARLFGLAQDRLLTMEARA